MCRYVERNPLRARLVSRAQAWRWSSLWQRGHGQGDWLDEWPLPIPVGRKLMWTSTRDGRQPAQLWMADFTAPGE